MTPKRSIPLDEQGRSNFEAGPVRSSASADSVQPPCARRQKLRAERLGSPTSRRRCRRMAGHPSGPLVGPERTTFQPCIRARWRDFQDGLSYREILRVRQTAIKRPTHGRGYSAIPDRLRSKVRLQINTIRRRTADLGPIRIPNGRISVYRTAMR